MSQFECPVVEIEDVRPISGAAKIESAKIFDFDVIVPKGQFHRGALAVYLPIGAILPSELAKSLKGSAKLFGNRKNRVKAFRLRGAISEGLLLGPLLGGEIGSNAAATLGIKKYEAAVPIAMRGRCVKLKGHTVKFDIENFKRHPGILLSGEPVEMTEKIHGTFCGVSVVRNLGHRDLPYFDTLVYSKGLGRRGFVFKDGDKNLYVETIKRQRLREKLLHLFGNHPATLMGEIFGGVVQDLRYGRAEPAFIPFDIYFGEPGKGRFLDRDEFDELSVSLGDRVPVIYRGPFDRGVLKELASGPSMLGPNLREGAVVTPRKERRHPRIGRVTLKYVSPEYLVRSGATERE